MSYGAQAANGATPPLVTDHLGDAAMARDLHKALMERVVANFDNEWELSCR